MKKEPNSNLRARIYKSWHSDSMDEVNSKTKMTEESMNWRKKLHHLNSREKMVLKNWTETQRLLENKRSSIYVIRIHEGEEKAKHRKSAWGKKMSEIFLNLAEDINLQM